MKAYSSRELIQIALKDGWYLVNTTGSHHQFKHRSKKGRLTIPHPRKDLNIRTIKSIFKQAQIDISKEER